MNCAQLIQVFEQQAAESYACDWDNVGLLAGSRKKEIKKVYIALDATDAAVQEAIDAQADLLLTHHPLLFHGIKRVTDDDLIGRRLISMIRADLAYYAMHTNFDVKGMAQLAAEKMGLTDCVPLEETCVEQGIPQGIGRVGSLEREMTLEECCTAVQTAFGRKYVQVFGTLSAPVRRAAICPGSGKSDVQYALDAGADVYITGDIDHHTGIDAAACGMAVIDAGHYGIEHIFVPYMAQYLRAHAPEITVVTQGCAEPFQIVAQN
ncbi:MAG: Nif3-like dinuclear metal center hexameric protein [Eubacterium sp.]|nr:Nif3-like dinuclear metal center hexameric protein [Eubacterium sp.]